MAYIAAQTERIILSTVHHADHHDRPGADRRGLRDPAAPHRRPDGPDARPRQHRPGLPVVRQGHPRGHQARDRELRAAAPALARGRRRLAGPLPHPAPGLHLHAAPARRRTRRSSGTARSGAPRSPSRRRTTATASSPTTSSGRPRTPQQMVALYRRRFEHYGHGTADQAIVGLGGQVFMRRNSQDAVREFRPYFDNAPVYGHGPSLEEFTSQTPLTVGSPQEVIEKTLGFREYVGDYQRQLFLMDHAGLPLKTVLEQLDLLGEEVVPVLRKEFAALRPAHVAGRPGAAPPTSRPERRHGREGVGMTRRIVVVSGRAEHPVVHPAARRPAGRRRCPRPSRPRARGRGRGRRAPAAGARAGRQPADRLPHRRAGRGRRDGTPGRRADRGDAGVLGVVLRAVQDVLRRAGAGHAGRHARCWSAPPPAPPGTRWCSTTRCARCSPTCGPCVVPTGVFAASEDFGGTGDGALSTRIERAAGELAALVAARPAGTGRDRRPDRRADGARRPRAVRGAAAPGLRRPRGPGGGVSAGRCRAGSRGRRS